MANYQDSDRLPSLVNPTACADRVVGLLKNSTDWEQQVDGLVQVRQLAVHHGKVIRSDGARYKAVVGYSLQCLDSLRSQLSKNAALTLVDLFEQVPAEVNAPLAPLLVPALLKRSSDNTNGFIREQARAALLAFCRRCPEHETLLALEAILLQKAASQRALAVMFIHVCLDCNARVDRQGDLWQRIAHVCQNMSRDANPEVRKRVRSLLAAIRGDQVESRGSLAAVDASGYWASGSTDIANGQGGTSKLKSKQQHQTFLPKIKTAVVLSSNKNKTGTIKSTSSLPFRNNNKSFKIMKNEVALAPSSTEHKITYQQNRPQQQEYMSEARPVIDTPPPPRNSSHDGNMFETVNASPWSRDISDFAFRYGESTPTSSTLQQQERRRIHKHQIPLHNTTRFTHPQRVMVVPVAQERVDLSHLSQQQHVYHSSKQRGTPRIYQSLNDNHDEEHSADFTNVLVQEKQWRQRQAEFHRHQLLELESQERQVLSEIDSLNQALAKIKAHQAVRGAANLGAARSRSAVFIPSNNTPLQLSSLGASLYCAEVTNASYGKVA